MQPFTMSWLAFVSGLDAIANAEIWQLTLGRKGQQAMARKTAKRGAPVGLNLSAAIRDYLADTPNAKPAEIVEHLFAQYSVEVSPQYVSTIKSNAKRKQKLIVSDDPALKRLQLAKEFCQQMGSIDQAQQAIRDWAALTE